MRRCVSSFVLRPWLKPPSCTISYFRGRSFNRKKNPRLLKSHRRYISCTSCRYPICALIERFKGNKWLYRKSRFFPLPNLSRPMFGTADHRPGLIIYVPRYCWAVLTAWTPTVPFCMRWVCSNEIPTSIPGLRVSMWICWTQYHYPRKDYRINSKTISVR